jgi:hypothetical protein
MKVHNDYKDAMDPKFKMDLGRIGAPTSPVTPKQLEEFSKRLNEGIKNVEVGNLQPEMFESIPTEHFETIRQLSKMTGSNVSMHAPMIDPAGFHENQWSEELRRSNEEHIVSIMDKAIMLTHDKSQKKAKGDSIPIVLHAGSTFSQEYDASLNGKIPIVSKLWNAERGTYEEKIKKDSEGKTIYREGIRKMGVINQATGQLQPVEHEVKEYPTRDKPVVFDTWSKINSMNTTQWEEEKLKLFSMQKDADEIRRRTAENMKIDGAIRNAINEQGEINEEIIEEKLGTNWQMLVENARMEESRSGQHLREINRNIQSNYLALHDKIKRFRPKEGDVEFEGYEQNIGEYEKEIDKINKKQMAQLKGLPEHPLIKGRPKKQQEANAKQLSLKIQQEWEDGLVNAIDQVNAPKVWKPVSEIAEDKVSETVANVMYKLYDRNKNIALEDLPTLALENFQPVTPLSRAEDLKAAIKLAREKFVEKMTPEVGKDRAKKAANKLIGATWDVGHINMMRRAGYSEEKLKELVLKEAKTIAKDVRHLHLTDNFGFGDSHLAPGMGNVPFKETLEEMEKAGFFNDPKRRAIVEAGALPKDFQISPTPFILDHFNSPLYKMGETSPHWRDERPSMYQETFVEYPQGNFNLYGSSFTTLPRELGGQVGGDKSRFSETPMA